MSGPEFVKKRLSSTFEPAETRLIVIEDSYYSRPIMMEVFRGVGIKNDNAIFLTTDQFLDGSSHTFEPHVLIIVHASEYQPDFDFVRSIRKLENDPVADLPIIYLSAMSTQSNIITARDAGVDEFLSRPVSARHLSQKLKKVMEAPERFVTTVKYTGPCRRRAIEAASAAQRRRAEDARAPSEDEKPHNPSEALFHAISELQNVCVGLDDVESSLVDRVRELSVSTMDQARDTDDIPLLQTATAVKCYLDGVGRSKYIESHVLEIGADALTQLAILPESNDSERASVAKLMTIAVQKKLTRLRKIREQTSAA